MTWHALITHPQKEFATQDILIRQGFQVVLPYEERFRRQPHSRRARKLIRYAMFPRYLFAEIPETAWATVLALKTVSGVVRNSHGLPATVAEHEVRRCETLSGAERPKTQIWRSFQVGEKVFVLDGPLRGQVLPLAGLSGRMATVRATLLGGERNIRVPVDQLEAA